MRIYRIKTSDFKNLINVDLLDKDKKSQVKAIESKYNCKAKRALIKATQVAMIITESGQYIITCKPCYQKSLLDILESVNIDLEKQVLIDKKEYKTSQELSIDELKAILQG